MIYLIGYLWHHLDGSGSARSNGGSGTVKSDSRGKVKVKVVV